MITGRVPFNGETTVAIAIKHIQEPMPSPRVYVPEVPISVEQIILKCTQKSPDRRYQNMQELIDDLKRSLMTPDEDFVKIADIDEDAATRAMSDRELKQVTNRVRARDEYDEYTVRVNKQSEKNTRSKSNTQSKPKSKPQPQTRTPDRGSSKKNKKKQKKEGSDKVTTIVAIIAAVLIGLIIIFVAGRAFGLFDFGKKPKEETEAIPSVSVTAPVGELGENELLVPDVKGMTYAEAVTTLNKEGFEVTKLEVSSDTVDKGNVVDQLPQAGTVAKRGDTIEVSVSSGASSSKVHVPNLIGLDPMDATAMLVEAGLQAGKLEETTNPDPNLEGKICYQSYTADSAVDAGTVVDLKYSVGVGTVTYSYVGNVESPAVEDSDYKAGSSCTVILSTTTGVELKRENTTTFPVSMNITGIPDCETGTVTIIYTVSVPGQTTTGEDGQIIETPAEDVERTVVRTVTFTKE